MIYKKKMFSKLRIGDCRVNNNELNKQFLGVKIAI